MDNTCVMCGAELPTECNSMVCKKCINRAPVNGVLCPSCGTNLEVMNRSTYSTTDGFGYSTIFHCNYCHSDWEREEEYLVKPVKFQRKYWG